MFMDFSSALVWFETLWTLPNLTNAFFKHRKLRKFDVVSCKFVSTRICNNGNSPLLRSGSLNCLWGTAVAQWLRCCATNRKVAGSTPPGVGGFFIDPGVDSGGRCVRLTTLAPSCALVTKSGGLNVLEPSGPVQVCNGTAWKIVSTYWYVILLSSYYTR